MATPEQKDGTKTSQLGRFLREPTLHFFAIAAAALLGQRLLEGDPHTIELSPALKADLLRRHQDQLSRPPTDAEIEAFLAAWKADEALYREALREGIDRDDATVRNVVINKMRERLILQTRMREPTEADLKAYLDRHRDEFEAPLLYEHEYVVFAKQAAGAEQERARYGERLRAGSTPTALGLRSTAANVDRARMDREFGPEVAEKVRRLPPGQWHELETGDRWLLVKLIRIQGGLPEPAELRARLVAGWKGELAQEALARGTRAIAERYRVEETSR
jgi:hypothetical protein